MAVESSRRHAIAGKPRASILDARANRVHLAFALSPVRRRDKAARPDAGTACPRDRLVDRVGPSAILVIGHSIPLPHHPSVQVAATGMARPDHPPVAIGRPFLAGHRGYADQSLKGPSRFDAAGPDPEPTPAGLATFGRVDAVQAHLWIHRWVCRGRAGSAGSRRTFHHPFLPRSSDNIAALNPLWSAEEAPTVLPKEHIK